MDLGAYFERIGFREQARPDVVTLKARHEQVMAAAAAEAGQAS
jgi:hypothetical protein